jgi:hypothetical protein
VAAVAAQQAGSSANEALALRTESAQIQAAASDQWAYYQAKGIKAAVAEASAGTWRALGKTPPPELEATAKRDIAQQAAIQAAARKLEGERDAREHESVALMSRHERFASAVTFFQVSIALGAMAALTKIRPLWWASIALGLAGAAMFALPLLR